MKTIMKHHVKLPFAVDMILLVAVLGISAWAILTVLSYALDGLLKLIGF